MLMGANHHFDHQIDDANNKFETNLDITTASIPYCKDSLFWAVRG